MTRPSEVARRDKPGWKRGHARIAAGGLEIAGAFALAPVPATTVAVCGRHQGVSPPAPEAGLWHGFSAHTTRAAALRYSPLDAVLFEVKLGGAIMSPGKHWVAARQEVVAAQFWALCRWCAEPNPAAGLARDVHGELPGALVPTCGARDHPVVHSLEDFTVITGVPATWASRDDVNCARHRLQPAVPPPSHGASVAPSRRFA